MDLSDADRVCSTRYVIPRFQHKDSNNGQYGRISNKESNNPRMKKQDNHTDKDEADDDTFKDYKDKD